MGSLHRFFQLFDLGTLSVSSVAPIFSVAAAGSVMAQAAGAAVPLAIVLIAIPFILCSWIFLSLNQHFPNAGASYHWSRRIIGIDFSNFQAWIIILAYFWSIPPILIPAAQFTYRALGIPHPGNLLQILGAMFWAVFALIVLLFGARMTARVTQIFLVIEVLSVAFMAVIGYAHWGPAAVGAADFSFSHLNWGGVIVCMVVAATIVDGWEIDSYASEEAKKPRITPGWGGIIGAVSVVAYYLLIWPLLLHQLPLDRLSTTSDTLSLWAGTVAPGLLPYFRIAIICSTAGSLWLTTFILSRALYAMGRDGVMPNWVAGLNRFGVPHWPVVLPMGLSMIVVALQMFFPSTRDLFNLVLSAAGFFLVGEFLLDGINMLVLGNSNIGQNLPILPLGKRGKQEKNLIGRELFQSSTESPAFQLGDSHLQTGDGLIAQGEAPIFLVQKTLLFGQLPGVLGVLLFPLPQQSQDHFAQGVWVRWKIVGSR